MLLLLRRLPPPPPPHHHRRRLSVPQTLTLNLKPPSRSPLPCLSQRRRPRCTPSSDSALESPDDELSRLLVLLPDDMRRRAESHPELGDLVEVVMDLGRRPLARFPSAGDVPLSDRAVTTADLRRATSFLAGDFAADNRAGISRTLHRISAIRNRKGDVVGLTCRVGRAVPGSADLLRDLVKGGESLLIIGPPGVGKTTIIRDIARMLADDYKKRVMIVDTSNEIGGDGDIPHAGIGSARRLQVPNSDTQHKVLIEAVENHMPQVIVIDEIGTKLEAMAASTIAQRGIQLVASAHGVTIENLIMNPSLEMLVGGVQSVTLGDEEASRRRVQKTVLERKGPSTFACGAEIISKTEIQVHHNLEATVDALLAGRSPNFEVRRINEKSSTQEMFTVQNEPFSDINGVTGHEIVFKDYPNRIDEKITDTSFNLEVAENMAEGPEAVGEICLYAYGISEASVSQAVKQLGMDKRITLTDNISEADVFLALHSKLKKNSQIQSVVKYHDIPIYVTKTNSLVQITRAICALVKKHASEFNDIKEANMSPEETEALEEARLAIEQVVIPKMEPVQLLPRPSHMISAQICVIERYKLTWEKIVQDSGECLRILPLQAGNVKKSSSDQLDGINTEHEDLFSSDTVNSSQDGIVKLPFLPE